MQLNNALPSSEDSERLILGAVLLDNAVMAQLAEKLKEKDFYSPRNRRIYAAMLELFKSNTPIEPGLIAEQIKKDGTPLDSIGGVAAITNLTFGMPWMSNVEEYIKVILDKSRIRQLIQICGLTTQACLAEEDNASELFDNHESLVHDIRNKEFTKGFQQMGPLVKETMDQMAEGGQLTLSGISTGYRELDEIMDGLQPTDLIIVAARPSMGKTALMLCIVCNVARTPGHVIGVFSMEMSAKQVVKRLIVSEAKIDSTRFKRGFIMSTEKERLGQTLAELGAYGIEIDDSPALSVLEIKAKARRLKARRGRLDLIVIDYIQLMKGVGKAENRQQEVSAISRELKAFAKEMDTPVIALSQLSRAPELRKPPRPLMSDLRESGSIEQDADIVTFIYRGDYYHETEENRGIAEIIVAKNRNGPTGTVNLAFLKQFTRFENYFGE